MKNIFKFMIPCLAVALAFTSCNDTMDDKATIDAKYAKATTATVALGNVEAVDFQTISADFSATGESELLEQGIQIAQSNDFVSNVETYPSEKIGALETIVVTKRTELTTYYVRSYAVTKTAGTIVSEVKSVTTPKAPIFPINGEYTAIEWDYNKDSDEWEAAGTYDITVEFDADDATIVNITNIWGGGMTVQGQYNEAKGIVTVPNLQNIYKDATYGDVWLKGINKGRTAWTSAVTFEFTALGGKMSSSPMAAQCSLGNFGFFYLTMEHK